MSIDSNIQKYESVCKPRDVCDGCIPQDAQNMKEPVWQQFLHYSTSPRNFLTTLVYAILKLRVLISQYRFAVRLIAVDEYIKRVDRLIVRFRFRTSSHSVFTRIYQKNVEKCRNFFTTGILIIRELHSQLSLYLTSSKLFAFFFFLSRPPIKINIIHETRHEKTCFCHMRTTKAQISLRFRAV